MQNINKEIDELKERNKRVEIDKARETSITRKIIIMILTYAIIVVFLYTVKLARPLINAIIPTLWFMVSTLSLPLFKKLRIKYYK